MKRISVVMRSRALWSIVLVSGVAACQVGDPPQLPDIDAATGGTDGGPDIDAPDPSPDGGPDAAIDAPSPDGGATDAAIDASAGRHFRTVGALAQARLHGHAAALLLDGRVLIVGGDTPEPNDSWTTAAELFDPASETFTTVGSTALVHLDPMATTLADGRVLVTGAAMVPGGLAPKTELFDPETRSFSAGPDMLAIHQGHVATALADGRVLVTGETNEVYDPASNTFQPMPPLNVLGPGHEAMRLADGRVLLCGGPHQGSSGGGTRNDAEELAPATNLFTSTGAMATPRASHRIAPLPGGRALVTGGYIGLGGAVEIFASAEIYDPTARTFSSAGMMTMSRDRHTATALADGRVLVTGGGSDGLGTAPDNTFEVVASAELFDPEARSFTATSDSMAFRRSGHTATRLLDGRVLLVGGNATPIAELYEP